MPNPAFLSKLRNRKHSNENNVEEVTAPIEEQSEEPKDEVYSDPEEQNIEEKGEKPVSSIDFSQTIDFESNLNSGLNFDEVDDIKVENIDNASIEDNNNFDISSNIFENSANLEGIEEKVEIPKFIPDNTKNSKHLI